MAPVSLTLSVNSSTPTTATLTPVAGLKAPVKAGTVVGAIALDKAGIVRGVNIDSDDASKFRIGGAFPSYTVVALVDLAEGDYAVGVNYLVTGSELKFSIAKAPVVEPPPVDPPPVDPPPTGTDDDGHANAPAVAAQYPRLLDGYTKRPPWRVAGVDYAVGVRPGVILKKPTAANLPTGTNLRPGAIYVTGNNVTLQGYDLTNFTVLVDDPATGTVTIVDCAATSGVNIRSTVNAQANLVVRYCALDGGGTASDDNFQTIQVWTPLIVEYCLIKNSPAATYSGAPTTIRYNAMVGFAWVKGAHANAIYCVGGNDPSLGVTIAYNTIWTGDTRNADGFPIGIGAAVALFEDGGNYYKSLIANNVVISALSGGASYLIGYYINAQHSAVGGVVRDNYMAWISGGAFGAFYASSPGRIEATYTGNIDMSTGKPVD